jgi:hypothetical protein
MLALCAQCIAQSPIAATTTRYVNELGLTIPLKNATLKNYVESHGLQTLPLTSGISNGVQFGRHGVISRQATIGVTCGANMFVGTDSVEVSQIYQLAFYLTGRLYFGDSWRSGFYAELGSGPELSAAKLKGQPLVFQANIGARVGVGYNIEFNDDVTIGVGVIAAPAMSAKTLLEGTKGTISMWW